MKNHARMVVITGLLCGSFVGCKPSTPPVGATPAVPKNSVVPNKNNDADDPLVKEARPDTEVVLDELIAGTHDNDQSLGAVERKVSGFTSWSIDSQELDPDLPNAVRFGGILTGPASRATFSVTMVKQQNGKWMVGTFDGPNAE